MCGRFAFTGWDEALIEAYDIEQSKMRPRYNIAPTQTASVILHDPDQQKAMVQDAYWGLIPSWAKDKSIGVRMINARSETAGEKASFKTALRYRRCLVPTTGFYEWRREGKAKVPFYFSPAKPQPLVFAGLWEDWGNGTEQIRSFTILTTAANETMSTVHDRMPIILQPKDWGRWLDPKINDITALMDLLQPCESHFLQKWQVRPYVNKAGNEGIDCIEKVENKLYFCFDGY